VVVVLLLLLVAAIFGVLGAVLKAALVIVLSIVLAFAILVGGTFWYLRYRLNRFVRDAERHQRGYPTHGEKRPGPTLPPD
jgi:Kef-type K+ transport system membrane component KefB